MAPARHYEPGMNFTYDEKSGKVSVAFRGRIAVLSDVYACEDDARVAAESFCKKQGWKGKENADPRSLLKFRRAG